MATTSGIALRSGDTYETIYCHWDGHPDTMLPILRGYYNSFELASKLISFGDASSINKNLEPAEGQPHDFMHPAEDTCVFYHRDRGEDWLSCRPTCYLAPELHRQSGFEYVYIFENGQWNAYASGRKLRR